MSKKAEQEAKEANFAGLCKQLYPKLEVADSIFVEALRKHGDEGLAMEEVGNWQPWESQAMDAAPAPVAPKPKANDPEDSIERQKREYEKFEKANKERLDREKQEKAKKEEEEGAKKAAQAKREEKARLKEQQKKAAKKREEEKARLAKEEKIRLAREEQAQLARLEREKAKAEEEMKARIRREIEQEEKEKREKEEKEKKDREKKDEAERQKAQKAEEAKRQKEEKEQREKEIKEKLVKEEKEKLEKEAKEKLEKEAKEKLEKEAKEKLEKEAKEKLEKEEKERQKQEEERIKKQVSERFEKEKREKEEKERLQKEEKERLEKEAAAKEKLEKEEKERLEKEEKEKAAAEDKGKEKSEDQDIGDIIKELADLKEMKVDFVGANAPPRISIYVGEESDLSAADHEKIKQAFMKKGIAEQEIRILGVAHDREIQQFLKTSLKKDPLVFPIVCVDGQPIGGPSDVYGLDDTQIEKLLSSTPEDPLFSTGADASDTSEVTLGAMNQVLTAGEYLASGVGSLLMLPVTALTWPFRSAPVDPNAIKGKNDVEFDVIHTNWYWRSQWRVFRFSDAFVARLHPRHRDMRAAHQYDTICRLQLTDQKNIVFHYSDNSSPDYLHAKEEDVREMVKIVQTKNPNVNITKGEE